jgi:hypothetical protein
MTSKLEFLTKDALIAALEDDGGGASGSGGGSAGAGAGGGGGGGSSGGGGADGSVNTAALRLDDTKYSHQEQVRGLVQSAARRGAVMTAL